MIGEQNKALSSTIKHFSNCFLFIFDFGLSTNDVTEVGCQRFCDDTSFLLKYVKLEGAQKLSKMCDLEKERKKSWGNF
jgi:hypothetical protein